MNPACILRLWREKAVCILQPLSLEYADALLAAYRARGWDGEIEERSSCA